MSGRARRGVQFNHQHANGRQSQGRRSSFSDVSEEGSGSPTKTRGNSNLENISEVCLAPDVVC